MAEKIKIGIIGTGSISDMHIQGYVKNPNVDLYAFCDLDEKLAREKAEKHSVKHVFTDYRDLLAMDEIDAVSICTWNAAHAPCAIAALHAGKHVLCEKPMAVSAELAAQMKAAADESGKLLMIGFVRRYGNDCKILMDFVKNGHLGDIYYAKATYIRKVGNPGGWFGNKELSGGGPLIDLGVHVIDLTRYLMGNPKPVAVSGVTFEKLGNRDHIQGKTRYKSASATDHDICNVEDMALALVRYDNGAALSVEVSFSLHTKQDSGCVELFGTKGGAKLNPQLELYTELENYLVDMTPDADTALSFDGLFDGEINHFVDCVMNGTPCQSPAQDGVDISRILDAIYESARLGREVRL